MNIKVIVAVVLIVLGVLGLIFKGFDYTSKEQVLKLGDVVEVNADVQKKADIPVWASCVVLGIGVVILVWSAKK